jgi:hypothetical protein
VVLVGQVPDLPSGKMRKRGLTALSQGAKMRKHSKTVAAWTEGSVPFFAPYFMLLNKN